MTDNQIQEKILLSAPFPLRIAAFIALILHSLSKIQGIEQTPSFFSNIVGTPPELAYPIALLEIIGRSLLRIGPATNIASVLFLIEMIGVILLVKFDKGFVGGFELELLILAISFSLLLSSPGRISIERDILKREIFQVIYT